MTELAKTFEPAAIEAKWYQHWEEGGLFRPERPEAEPFTIVIPPPNVTGVLHIGHALDDTLQDILVRKARMEGKDALWVVGMDHAGIATQMVVERQLDGEGKKRTDMGREAFLERVWQWKEESGGQITKQLRRLGASCDWSNERFTMDEGFSKAVTHVFVELFKRKLLYRDKRLVNWDPKFETAISDLEVEQKEQAGHFWHLSYPLADGSGSIEVATTRPETMLADMAVAVHPEDARYEDMVGKMVKLPITGREIPIVTDEHADPELGSGAVKITPGHDFNDFEVGKRAGIAPADMLNMLTSKAAVCQTADGLVPETLVGLDRFDARKRVVEMLEAEGALIRVEDRTIQAPYGDRSGVIIEPWLTDQWYVDAETLSKPALEAVKSGDIDVVPETWKKTWYNWLENIQPWCVSRQLWWGHRIPAWYDDAGNAYVALTEEEAQAEAGEGVQLRQDEDVLDTWFSSALWPFATLGWPEDTETLKRHYPNDVLISGFDIIFFWDARMAMQGFEFMGEKPWKRLYLHGLVRDKQGAKMSKSKGNVVDPLTIVDKYGADALRFTLTAMESQGRDIKLDEKRVEGYRNFATKLWNAARFLQGNGIGASDSIAAPAATKPVNRWIIGEVVGTLAKLEKAFDELRFDGMADAIYHFAWGTFCDWYVELIKGEMDEETKAVAGWAFDQILVMLHPFMPFITEELWHSMADPAHPRPYDLILAKWPQPEAGVDAEAKRSIDWTVALITEVRALRAELNIPWSSRLTLHPLDGGATEAGDALDRMGKAEWGAEMKTAPEGSAQIVVAGHSYAVPLADAIDLDAERARLAKAAEAAEKEVKSLEGRLNNPNFVERAKPEAVAKAREDHAARAEEASRLRAALERLG
ncbi:valine--tRNA ligase [Sphingomicrobium aestuariivivum]|uniref:valine--tRNA ligase n=1 Tax=Sphingomicrobium aestuariivivum TaxID=1582356 RepID=UPI001FD6D23E|nr:valine--tRNA ligase [Sphingomicrobium aestuariivivum]MCJ8191722.1 valine--tRNA ligase [Sphingomicrobium aestuariivivum]